MMPGNTDEILRRINHIHGSIGKLIKMAEFKDEFDIYYLLLAAYKLGMDDMSSNYDEAIEAFGKRLQPGDK